jgi:hypothetical protein
MQRYILGNSGNTLAGKNNSWKWSRRVVAGWKTKKKTKKKLFFYF